MRRQNRETDAELGEQLERFQIHRGFRQPHSFRRALESIFEVADAPEDLRDPIAAVGQRHDDVIVNLRHGGAVAGKIFLAFPVGVEDRRVDFRRLGFQPDQQRRTEVEADLGVVIDQLDDAVLARRECARPNWARSIPR